MHSVELAAVSDTVLPICNSGEECEERAEKIFAHLLPSPEHRIKLRQNCREPPLVACI
jgi:hypothetical protein